MPNDPKGVKHAPRITKTLRPKTAPPDGVASSMAVLDGKSGPSSIKSEPSKRPKSCPDLLDSSDTVPQPAVLAALHKPTIVRRSVDVAQSQGQLFHVVSGRQPTILHTVSPKTNKMQVVTDSKPRNAIADEAEEAAADTDGEPLCEPVSEEEEVDAKEASRHVGFTEAPECKQKEESDNEEVFEDDFDTDEEPPSPRCSSVMCPQEGLVLNKDCWGRLISLTHQQPNVDLTTKEGQSFSLGRSSKCDVIIDDPHISGMQFTITMYNRTVCEVEIRDLSSNGTYCNAQKVGKGKAKTLSNGDEITFQVTKAEAGTTFAGYIFQFLSPNLHNVRQQQYRRNGKEADAEKGRKPKVKYKISDVLGRGGFATVYLGMNQDTGELIAVKQIHVSKNESAKIKAICKEIDILRSLSHSKVVQYLGYEVEAGYLNILLEYVPGGSIASLLEKFGEFDENVIRLYTLQILIGLNYLHENNVIHRDIKGANILVTQRGTVKLTDFGSARATMGAMPGNTERAATETRKGLEGTVLWMAPEVISHSQYSLGSDVWALACTIIEMATNQPPWAEKNLTSYVSAMYFIATATEPPALPAKLQSEAKDFLRQCLRLNVEERPNCAALLRHPFITQVETVETGGGPEVTTGATVPQARPAGTPGNLALSRPSSQHQHQIFLQQQAELQQSQLLQPSLKRGDSRLLAWRPPASAGGGPRQSPLGPPPPDASYAAEKARKGRRHHHSTALPSGEPSSGTTSGKKKKRGSVATSKQP